MTRITYIEKPGESPSQLTLVAPGVWPVPGAAENYATLREAEADALRLLACDPYLTRIAVVEVRMWLVVQPAAVEIANG